MAFDLIGSAVGSLVGSHAVTGGRRRQRDLPSPTLLTSLVAAAASAAFSLALRALGFPSALLSGGRSSSGNSRKAGRGGGGAGAGGRRTGRRGPRGPAAVQRSGLGDNSLTSPPAAEVADARRLRRLGLRSWNVRRPRAAAEEVLSELGLANDHITLERSRLEVVPANADRISSQKPQLSYCPSGQYFRATFARP